MSQGNPITSACEICGDDILTECYYDKELDKLICHECRRGIVSGTAILRKLGVSGMTTNPDLPDMRPTN